MEKLKADFVQLQTEVATMRSQLDGVDKFFSVCQSLKKNSDNLNERVINQVETLSTAFDDLRSQVIKQQVSMKKDIVGIQKEMEKAKNEMEAVKKVGDGVVTKQLSASEESSRILKEIDQMKAELQAANNWESKADDFNEQMEQIKQQLSIQHADEMKSQLLIDDNEALNLSARIAEMNTKLASLDGMVNQFQLILDQNRNEQRAHQPPSTNVAGRANHAVPEWVLRERKRNNVIIFGLEESENDVVLIHSLFQNLESPCTADDIRGIYRVGNSSVNKKRPIVIKFASIGMKNAILSRASQLRWHEKWRGVVITHDLTKIEYLEEKQREFQLKKSAEERNQKLTESEKKLSLWKVIGGRGRRHVALILL